MTEEELREWLDRLLIQYRDHVQECYKQNALAPEIASYRDAIYRNFKQAKYVQLSPDQRLPECNIVEQIDFDKHTFKYRDQPLQNYCPLLKANFKKVKP